MIVKVKLYGRLRGKAPTEARGQLELELPLNTTVRGSLVALHLDDDNLVQVNGQHEDDGDRVLQDGDSLAVFPQVMGG